MDIISDIVDSTGKRRVVVSYTDEEKAKMAEEAAARKAEMDAKINARRTAK